MTGTVFSKFFWSDWLSDPGVRASAYGARGLWMDMLCIAATAEPYGYLVVNGRPLDAADIARLTGGQLHEVEILLSELERNGVFSRDRAKRIYSRRMVRDAKKAAIARKNGKEGGNPTLTNKTGNSASDNLPDKPPDKPHKPQATIQNPEQQAHHLDAARARAVSLRAEIVRVFEGKGSIPPDTSRVDVWLAQGYSAEIILAVIREHAGKKNVRTLNYFDEPIREAHEARNKTPAAAKAIDWNHWAASWARDKAIGEANWPRAMQPNPGEAGCRCPPEILRQHGVDPSTGELLKPKENAA